MRLEYFKLKPLGKVKRSVNYGTNKVEFENGIVQRQRKWIKPRITFSFEVGGVDRDRRYLNDFIDRHQGDLKAFWWEYDSERFPVRFDSPSVETTEIRERGSNKIVGFKASIGLVVQKEGEYTVSNSSGEDGRNEGKS